MSESITSFDECTLEHLAAEERADFIRNEAADLDRMAELEQGRQSMIREQMLTALRAIDTLPVAARKDAETAVFWLGAELGVA